MLLTTNPSVPVPSDAAIAAAITATSSVSSVTSSDSADALCVASSTDNSLSFFCRFLSSVLPCFFQRRDESEKRNDQGDKDQHNEYRSHSKYGIQSGFFQDLHPWNIFRQLSYSPVLISGYHTNVNVASLSSNFAAVVTLSSSLEVSYLKSP